MLIAVTGAAGQVGAAIVERLRPHNAVVGLDRATLDLAKPDFIPRLLDEVAPDLLINAAAYTQVDRAEDEEDVASLVNAQAPGVMGRWAADSDVPFIHFSTDYVFDGTGQHAWRETDIPRPLSVYGRTKREGEEKVLAAGGPVLVVRTSWVYSKKGRNFLRKIVELAGTEKELRVVADQVGAPTSAALISDAIAEMIAGGVERFRKHAAEASGIVHLVASGETTWHQFAVEIVKGLQARDILLTVEHVTAIRTEERPARAKRPLNSRFSLERLQSIFGIVPPDWRMALGTELDELAQQILDAGVERSTTG